MRFGKTVWAALLLLPVLAMAPAFAEAAPSRKTPVAASASAASATPPPASSADPAAPPAASAAAPAASAAAAAPAPTAPSSGPAPAPASKASAGPAGMDGATYAIRLRDLEQRIDELKEQIRRSHTRLSLLTDTILSGGVAGARATVRFSNEMSSAFRLTKALFVLDGAVQYNKSDESGALAEQQEIPIFDGSIPPGDHTVQVLLQLQGNGYGVFSYLKGYHFEVKSSHSFTAVEGKTIALDVIGYEKGGVTTALEERPAVRYAEKVTAGVASAGAAPAAPAAPAPVAPTVGASTGVSIGAGGK